MYFKQKTKKKNSLQNVGPLSTFFANMKEFIHFIIFIHIHHYLNFFVIWFVLDWR